MISTSIHRSPSRFCGATIPSATVAMFNIIAFVATTSFLLQSVSADSIAIVEKNKSFMLRGSTMVTQSRVLADNDTSQSTEEESGPLTVLAEQPRDNTTGPKSQSNPNDDTTRKSPNLNPEVGLDDNDTSQSTEKESGKPTASSKIPADNTSIENPVNLDQEVEDADDSDNNDEVSYQINLSPSGMMNSPGGSIVKMAAPTSVKPVSVSGNSDDEERFQINLTFDGNMPPVEPIIPDSPPPSEPIDGNT